MDNPNYVPTVEAIRDRTVALVKLVEQDPDNPAIWQEEQAIRSLIEYVHKGLTQELKAATALVDQIDERKFAIASVLDALNEMSAEFGIKKPRKRRVS